MLRRLVTASLLAFGFLAGATATPILAETTAPPTTEIVIASEDAVQETACIYVLEDGTIIIIIITYGDAAAA
jgi:hypothetical protein